MNIVKLSLPNYYSEKFDVNGITYGLVIRPDLDDNPSDDHGRRFVAELFCCGEAIASAYLTSHRNCCFPWDDSRDVRKPKSSLPGADLVGFSDTGDNCRFAFGEVKTSSENAYPPQVMSYSGDGLAAQMKNLRDDVLIRNRLLAYLGYRAKNAQWKDSFKTATRKYLNNQMDISVFGVLVRDVLPNEKDLKGLVIQLSSGNRVPLEMEAIALYLPDGAIEDLPVLCDSIERGDITC